VSEGIQVIDAQVLAGYEPVSDHLPLLVEIRLP
jgi:endonuclease/exonuclease/phosphatase family metal-dependent hydrolase